MMNKPEQRNGIGNHDEVWQLLPWYLNGSLDDSEAVNVRTHLGECLVCAREVRRLRRLEQAVRVPIEHAAASQSFARFNSQLIRQSRPQSRLGTALRRFLGLFEPVPLAAGAAVLVLSSAITAAIVLNGDADAGNSNQSFETLGAQQLSASRLGQPQLRVVLRDGFDAPQLAAWLSANEAELIDGPSDIGVLTVGLTLGKRDFEQRLAEIRADSATLFVEPISRIGKRPDRQR